MFNNNSSTSTTPNTPSTSNGNPTSTTSQGNPAAPPLPPGIDPAQWAQFQAFQAFQAHHQQQSPQIDQDNLKDKQTDDDTYMYSAPAASFLMLYPALAQLSTTFDDPHMFHTFAPSASEKRIHNIHQFRVSYRYPQSAIRSDPHHFNGYRLTYHPIRQVADRPTTDGFLPPIRQPSATYPIRNPIRKYFASNPQVIRSTIQSTIQSASDPQVIRK